MPAGRDSRMGRYAVKECYFTLQGEGAQTGRAAVFLRFAGCNLWSGREADRAAAICRFCDTDFVGVDGPGGGSFDDAAALTEHVAAVWRAHTSAPAPAVSEPGVSEPGVSEPGVSEPGVGASGGAGAYVVCTGGEPLLQLDDALIDALQRAGFAVAVETNGTLPAPSTLDWICVSPKAGAPLRQTSGHEIKLVYPQADAPPETYASLGFEHFFLQPLDGPAALENTAAAVDYCKAHPQWRLSLQTHKLIGLP